MKTIVAAKNLVAAIHVAICRTNSNWFEFFATNHSDEMIESSVVAACIHFLRHFAATKYKLTNERASFIFL